MSTFTTILGNPFLRRLTFGTSSGRRLVYREARHWAGSNWLWLLGGGLVAAALVALAFPRVRARLLGRASISPRSLPAPRGDAYSTSPRAAFSGRPSAFPP